MLLRFRRAGALLAGLSLVTSQACYAYRPAATATVPEPLEQIRIVLTADGVAEMARYLGPSVVAAEGDLSSIRDDGGYVVAVRFVQQANGIRQPWTGEGLVTFPGAYRAQVHERYFLRNQSIVAGVALSVGLVALAVIALKVGGALGGGDAGGPPPP